MKIVLSIIIRLSYSLMEQTILQISMSSITINSIKLVEIKCAIANALPSIKITTAILFLLKFYMHVFVSTLFACFQFAYYKSAPDKRDDSPLMFTSTFIYVTFVS